MMQNPLARQQMVGAKGCHCAVTGITCPLLLLLAAATAEPPSYKPFVLFILQRNCCVS
jgi:hypothetical protein